MAVSRVVDKVLEIPPFFLIFEKMPQKFRVFSSFLRKCLENSRFFKIILSSEILCHPPPFRDKIWNGPLVFSGAFWCPLTEKSSWGAEGTFLPLKHLVLVYFPIGNFYLIIVKVSYSTLTLPTKKKGKERERKKTQKTKKKKITHLISR